MAVSAPIICLEGNISAGKSTLCREASELSGFRVFLEPTVKNPFLGKFYQDPKRYGLRMQIWLLRQRYFTYLKAIRHILDTGLFWTEPLRPNQILSAVSFSHGMPVTQK